MQFSKKIKKQILNGFIDIFTRISNREYQKRVWIKGEGPEVDDFDDIPKLAQESAFWRDWYKLL